MQTQSIDLSHYENILKRINPIRIHGKVSEIIGLMVEGHGPAASIGDVCGIVPVSGEAPLEAEVVGFRNGRVLLMPLESMVATMDREGFGPCTNVTECSAVCPKEIDVQVIARMNRDRIGAIFLVARRSLASDTT